MKESNLLQETLEELKKHGKSPKDVRWVGSKDGEFAISWEEFEKIADVEYYRWYGAENVAIDLVVVGDDWWLERYVCEGFEMWEFKTQPRKRPDAKKFTRVIIDAGDGECLRDLNKKVEE